MDPSQVQSPLRVRVLDPGRPTQAPKGSTSSPELSEAHLPVGWPAREVRVCVYFGLRCKDSIASARRRRNSSSRLASLVMRMRM